MKIFSFLVFIFMLVPSALGGNERMNEISAQLRKYDIQLFQILDKERAHTEAEIIKFKENSQYRMDLGPKPEKSYNAEMDDAMAEVITYKRSVLRALDNNDPRCLRGIQKYQSGSLVKLEAVYQGFVERGDDFPSGPGLVGFHERDSLALILHVVPSCLLPKIEYPVSSES